MYLDPLTNIQISKDRQHDAQMEAARARLVRSGRARFSSARVRSARSRVTWPLISFRRFGLRAG